MPVLGFGTWLITGDDATEAVRDALEIGYRQIDTARAYENEREVGRGIADSGVAREEIFLTTKVPHDEASADEVQRDCEQSLERLGVDYLDLLLLHWPNPDVPLEETLKALTALAGRRAHPEPRRQQLPGRTAEAGARHGAGVRATRSSTTRSSTRAGCSTSPRANDVLITAYSPLAHGKVPGDETLNRIGQAHDKTAGQVALRWLLDQPT